MADTGEKLRIDHCLAHLLNASNEAAAVLALRKLFVEELDFGPIQGTIELDGPGLPSAATRIAGREGVQVVAVRLTTRGRVLVRDIREVYRQLRQQLGEQILIAAGDADGGVWQLVYPSTRSDKEILRRIVLHRGQPHRTVVEQLSSVYERAKRGDLRDALESVYDVEAVTKAFFERYRDVFEYAEAHVTGLPDKEERRLFCQTLFNRLMFIYFLQRKGWLTFNGNADYLPALWKDTEKDGENFYEERLKLLFFVGLSSPRSAEYSAARELTRPKIGDTPFLNGGLFSPGELDKRQVGVPNRVIERVLNDLFRPFNFTIDESTPYDVQVAVDPEMLGKVFEELVTGRHETGSYYTPRPIVSFMCRQALKGYLLTQVPGLSEEAAAKYVDDNDVSGITREAAGAILEALGKITVVDPACGSGAYLLGMMQELLECENLLYNQKLIADARSQYDIKLRIIARNVYGVDIDPFAVNIAMLRLWLSLIVEYEGDDPPPLPNLDFKIACGDSLTGPNPQALQPDLIGDRLHQMAEEITQLKREYLRMNGDPKEQRKREIEREEQEMAGLMAHSDIPESAVDWQVQFAEVFERGGFDVVVANPPYVRQELIKEHKPRLKTVYGNLYSGTADLYVYFYYRALQLLSDSGMLAFISSNKWFRAAYGAKLRELIADTTAVRSIIDFGDLPVFQGATAYPMIFLAEKGGAKRPTCLTEVPSLQPPYPDVDAVIAHYGFQLPVGAIEGSDWQLSNAETAAQIEIMRRAGTTLGEYVGGKIYYGIKTGFNKAFVIDGKTREELIAADPRSAEIIKPFIVGKDIRRWRVDYKDRWLIFTRRGINISEYPAIEEHLRHWEQDLTPKKPGAPRDAPGRKPGRYKWYEIQDDVAYFRAFEERKIVYPVIAKRSTFAFDGKSSFTNDKAFIIPTDDLFLLAVLNSDSGWTWLRAKCSPLQNGFREFRAIYMEQFPVPAAGSGVKAAIADLVRRLVEENTPTDEQAAIEAELNAQIAVLYGLRAGRGAKEAVPVLVR